MIYLIYITLHKVANKQNVNVHKYKMPPQSLLPKSVYIVVKSPCL